MKLYEPELHVPECVCVRATVHLEVRVCTAQLCMVAFYSLLTLPSLGVCPLGIFPNKQIIAIRWCWLLEVDSGNVMRTNCLSNDLQWNGGIPTWIWVRFGWLVLQSRFGFFVCLVQREKWDNFVTLFEIIKVTLIVIRNRALTCVAELHLN